MKKLKFQAALAFVLLMQIFVVRADEIGGLVLMPDGKPAENAKIIARDISPVGPGINWEVTTETDLMGYFDATVPEISYSAASGRWNRPYLLVDAPGCAVSFILLGEVEKRKDQQRAIIRLEKDSPFHGIVMGPQNKPVSGAEIKIVYWSWVGYESSPLNRQPNISTPQLSAKSGADGKFSLRNIHVPGPIPIWGASGSISVTATINGSLWTTTHPLSNRARPVGALEKPLVVKLGPTVTFSGHIRDAVTGRGLSDVAVSVVPYSTDLTASVRTDYDGSFKVTSRSQTDAQLRLVQYNTDIPNWPSPSDNSRQVETIVSKSENLSGPLWIKNLDFRLPPIVSIRGQLIDEATGQKPLVQDDVIATSPTTTQNGWQLIRQPAFNYSRNGEFLLTVPIGSVTIASGVRKEYSHAYVAAPQKFEVPAKGLQNVILKVKRNPGFFVRLRSANDVDLPFGRYTVHLERADGTQAIKEMNDEVGGHYWFAPTKNWGDTAKLRLLRDTTPITAWRPVVASKEKWPLVLRPGQ